MEDLTKLIAGQAFFKDIDPAYAELLAASAQPARFAPNELIASEGDPTHRFYLILRGEVRIEGLIPGRGPEAYQIVRAGDSLGWSWMFPPFRWHFTVRASQEVEALAWDTAQLRDLAEKNPAFGYEMARRLTHVLVRRLQTTHAELVEYYGSTN